MLRTITSAKYIKDFILNIEFDNGVFKEIDFSTFLDFNETLEKPLKSIEYFKNFSIVGRGNLEWPNGFDVCSDFLFMQETQSKKEIEKAA